MKRRYRFILNGTFLAVVGILIRTVSVSFNGYVSRRIGAEGMGLFSLVMSVYGLAVTLASSGINLATVRMTAESLAAGGKGSDVGAIMRRAAIYGVLFGILSGTLVFVSADFTGRFILGDPRTVNSLRIMAFGMPPIAVTSALAGYFTGVGRAYKNAVVSVAEQGVKIFLILASIVIFLPKGTEAVCFGLVGSSSLAEGGSLLLTYLLYVADKHTLPSSEKKEKHRSGVFRQIVSIAFPVAVGSYIRQGFTTAEHIAIPWGLKKSGADSGSALESYGIMCGMALPLVLYPSAVIGAFTGLLVPELAGLLKSERRDEVRRTALYAVRMAIVFSVGVAGALSFFGFELGVGVYASTTAGRFTRLLAPLVPMMFLDTTVDCILKGLGEQVYTMKVNIIDAAICLVFVLLLVPRMGIYGYVVVIYVSEAINAALSILRMQKVTGARVDPLTMLIPFLWAGLSYAIVNIVDIVLVYSAGYRISIASSIVMFGLLYVGITYISGDFSAEKGSKNFFEKIRKKF